MRPPGNFSEYKGSSVLITGGLGFIGSNLALRLAEVPEVEISIVDALRPDQGGNPFNIARIKDRVKLHLADISDETLSEQLVSGVDYIFNLAGSVSHIGSMLEPQSDLALNCTSQLKFLEACRKFNPHVKIIFSSTRQVYGKPLYFPLDELHRVAPPDENYHLLYHQLYGMRAVCLRLTNTYGPRQLMHHNRQGFMAWFIRQAIDGTPIDLLGGGKQRRDLNYVDDVVEALLLAGTNEASDGEVFNLGGEESVSLAEVTEELLSLTGSGSVRSVPFPPERQLIDVGNFHSSFSKIERTLGWRPHTSLRVGLARTVEYYRQNRAHYWTQHDDSVSRSETTIS
ncbi:MAG: NAD-dependent epimerase [Acidobacteria bacterium]|nr:MAG: NAD-dependent epimerase [Acidobacteriota bacterium]